MKVYRMRFTEDAVEQRIEEGTAGKPDRPYTVTHKRGDEMDVSAATLNHWMSRGKAVEVGPATGEPESVGTVRHARGPQLPPPPA